MAQYLTPELFALQSIGQLGCGNQRIDLLAFLLILRHFTCFRCVVVFAVSMDPDIYHTWHWRGLSLSRVHRAAMRPI